MVLLKDDLVKAGPYKRDHSGIPASESVIKLHAVVFKHAQKKIIEREISNQSKRIKLLQDKDMVAYRNLVSHADIEYRQIENYVREKALQLMNLDIELYNLAFTRAL